MGYKEEIKLHEKLVELRRTIVFLCNTMTNVVDEIDKNPGMAKLMLKDSVDDPRYEYK